MPFFLWCDPPCTCIPQEKCCVVVAKGFCKYEYWSTPEQREVLEVQCDLCRCVGVFSQLSFVQRWGIYTLWKNTFVPSSISKGFRIQYIIHYPVHYIHYIDFFFICHANIKRPWSKQSGYLLASLHCHNISLTFYRIIYETEAINMLNFKASQRWHSWNRSGLKGEQMRWHFSARVGSILHFNTENMPQFINYPYAYLQRYLQKKYFENLERETGWHHPHFLISTK